MLKALPKKGSSGFTLVEMVIVVVIVGILAGLALPSFFQMLRNSEIRNAAESIRNGLQRARAEAVSRNNNVSFTLGPGSSWRVAFVSDSSTIDSRSGNEGSAHVSVVAKALDGITDATAVTFNNIGQIVPNTANLVTVDLTAVGGDKNLRVTVGAGGNARVCDPSLASGSSPRAC